MKRFFPWLRRPHVHIHFTDPSQEGNPLAEQAIESLRGAIENLKSAVALVNKLHDDLAQCRAELVAYAAASMEPEEQVAELERMGKKDML